MVSKSKSKKQITSKGKSKSKKQITSKGKDQEQIERLFIKFFYILVSVLEGKLLIDELTKYIVQIRDIVNSNPTINISGILGALRQVGLLNTLNFMFQADSMKNLIKNGIYMLRETKVDNSVLKQRTEEQTINYIINSFITVLLNNKQ
jgi:hypothetical protein